MSNHFELDKEKEFEEAEIERIKRFGIEDLPIEKDIKMVSSIGEQNFATKGITTELLSGDADDISDKARTATPVTLFTDATVTTISSNASEADLALFNFRFTDFILHRAIRIYAYGTYSTVDATPTVVIRVGTGAAATTEWNSMTSTAAAVTDQPWWFVWTGIINAVGSSGTMQAQMYGNINNVNKDDPNTSTVTLDTTANHVFAVTADWSAADASNSISIRQFIVSIL